MIRAARQVFAIIAVNIILRVTGDARAVPIWPGAGRVFGTGPQIDMTNQSACNK